VKLQKLRADLSQLEELKAGRLQNESTKRFLFSKYKFSSIALPMAIETVKQQVVSIAGRLCRYRKCALKRKQNHLFRTDQQALYKMLCADKTVNESITPDASQTLAFWESIWSQECCHNVSATWLEEL